MSAERPIKCGNILATDNKSIQKIFSNQAIHWLTVILEKLQENSKSNAAAKQGTRVFLLSHTSINETLTVSRYTGVKSHN